MQYDDDENGSEVILIAEGHDALLGSLKDLVLTELPHASVLTVRSGKEAVKLLSLIHISEPTRQVLVSRMPSSA